MNRAKTAARKFKFYLLAFGFAFCGLFLALHCSAQTADTLEFTLDLASNTYPTPKIFRPNIDLEGRGFHHESAWPQTLASKESLEAWQKDIGFKDLYRIQYNLWDITQLAKDKEAQGRMLANYENIIKAISDAGGVVILDIFGTPAGMGKILDKKTAPVDATAFKALIKDTIKNLSCDKKYNIWYEVWDAPDLEGFFLGREAEYLNLYRLVSESIKELESQYKIHIPVGGPGVSSWFRGIESNTIFSPEKSLIYSLIKFCYRNRLSLDFITWHGFSCDPKAEKEATIYNKNAVDLVRDWLSYFNLNRDTPLIVDEWNYDRDANLLPERMEKSYIGASYIPARLKNMHEAGVNNQVYFCLEDFQNNKEGITRNVGVFYFDGKRPQYKGGPKVIYNVFRMLKELGPGMFSAKLNDEFVGVLATKSEDGITLLVYNYIDPEITRDFLSEHIAGLSITEGKSLLNIIRSDQLPRIISQHEDVETLRVPNKVKSLLKNAQELADKAERLKSAKRSIKLNLKNIKGTYLYKRFIAGPSCSLDCGFKADEEKEITAEDSYQEELSLEPYSVSLIVLKKKPEPPKPEPPKEEPAKDANAAGK